MGGSYGGSDFETGMDGSGSRWCRVLAATHAKRAGRVTRLSKVVGTPAPVGVPSFVDPHIKADLASAPPLCFTLGIG